MGPYRIEDYRGSGPPALRVVVEHHVYHHHVAGPADQRIPRGMKPDVAPRSLAFTPPRGIGPSLDLWGQDLERRGRRKTTARQFRGFCERCARHCGWLDIQAMSYAGAAEWLGLRRAEGWSVSTHDLAATALRSFGLFLHKRGDLAENPFLFLERAGGDSGLGARALTTADARALIAATLIAQESTRRTRANRAAWYTLLCLTGLRTAEAAALRWSDVDTDGWPRAIYTDPKWAKNRRRQRIALAPEAVAVLMWHKDLYPPGLSGAVFERVPNLHVWHEDRERAGIARRDGRGRGATPHSCRKWLATALDAAGVTPGVAARVLRHSVGLTQRVYVDPPG